VMRSRHILHIKRYDIYKRGNTAQFMSIKKVHE
jgi:hypothetical protein